MSTAYRGLPSVDKLLAHPAVAGLLQRYARAVVVGAVREQLQAARQDVKNGDPVPSPDQVAEAVAVRALHQWGPWPVRVINATGVILHTNLGRAPLSVESVEAMASVAQGYSNLELDLNEGRRGSRHQAVSELVRQLTGAQAALVLNNNAAAVLLGLAALATGREVVVSRGESVEIGGGFRVPDVLRQSGAHLVEVGTANRTYTDDYVQAFTGNTGALLAVHRSNFQVVGFTHQPTLTELSEVAKEKRVPLLHDLGSGALLDTAAFGLAHEPMPQESLASGTDLVFFSGDKLLGGPQSGIVAGRADLVRRLAQHPMTRAMRPDKLTLAALHATLLHYLRGEAEHRVPIWQMIATPSDDLRKRAEAWAVRLGDGVDVVQGLSTLGGGSLPGETMATWLLSIAPMLHPGGADGIARSLRLGTPPVMVRIEEGRVLLDPRTVLRNEEAELTGAVRAVLGR